MCGIVGIVSKESSQNKVIAGLESLEYRGYDSSGIASIHNGNIELVRAVGKLDNLKYKFDKSPISGNVCVGHTRWATHGKPTEENAHPIVGENVALVHNGIIENYEELKNKLIEIGCIFKSETDTEVIALLINQYIKQGFSPKDSVLKTVNKISGSFALGIIFKNHNNLLIGVKQKSPLIMGYNDKNLCICSDAIGLSKTCNEITYMNDGEVVIIENGNFSFINFLGMKIEKTFQLLELETMDLQKGNYKHFMIKEIMKQPFSIGKTLSSCSGIEIDDNVKKITIMACGTSYYAGFIAKYWFEKYLRISTAVEISSEYQYRHPVIAENEIFLAISQSGETSDTISAMNMIKDKGRTLSIVNVKNSSIARLSHDVFYTEAGVEIGVASTKAFTAQLAILAMLAFKKHREIIEKLCELPELCSKTFDLEEQIKNIANDLRKYKSVIFLGRGVMYPIAMEGALKLKELTYIHAEAFAAGELKHGAIALIDDNIPVIILAPFGELFDKTRSNIQEVLARGSKVIVITDEIGACHLTDDVQKIIVPTVHESLSPFIYVIPLQLLAYHTSDIMNLDVDRPRNLAKSVTVE